MADVTYPGPTQSVEEVDRALEAIVLVAEEPIPTGLLAQLTEVAVTEVRRRLLALADGYRRERRGFQLVEIGGGWRFQTHPDLAPYVERYVLDGQSTRLSAAALETLAIVAYKQPVSRAQVASIRGVNADGVIRTLQQRGLITEVARDSGPGQATLYGTTRLFLERLGLNHVQDLPALADFVPPGDVLEALEVGLRAGDDPRRHLRRSEPAE